MTGLCGSLGMTTPLGMTSSSTDTGVLQAQMRGVTGGGPGADHPLHTLDGDDARRPPRERIAKSPRAFGGGAGALGLIEQMERVHHAIGAALHRFATRRTHTRCTPR